MTWQPQTLPADHPPVRSGRIGVLIVNLGTPDGADAKSVKRYLGEFLSDKRVVEIPAIAWQPILRGIILNTRPKKSAHAYQQVWTEDGSPLAAITKAQAEKMQARLGEGVTVDWAMRYGNPSIPERLTAMKDAGCERILLAPLYPQYCAATTATVVDKAGETLSKMRWQPSLRTLPPYHDDPLYIDALADDLARQLDALDFEPELLMLSFHGMPERTLHLGDPYHCHCQKTARLLEARMNRPDLRFRTTFQSRFGRAKWLEPATDTVLAEEGAKGTRRIAIAAPGFSADCLETLEELAMQGRDQFKEAGGEHFAALSCLNTSDAGLTMLEGLLRRELAGWIPG
ncbi:ferrochelatase [Erythrobacter sp. HI0063]|jgi:ferrochelatase|nr:MULTISPECIES: ferrochelatase [unclassified Erythrobacter]KZY54748.1 ferrochelatase [Erythrobacter sp. HI0063]MBO9511628.1 ferrochelatase [Erythrobacter sp. A6_0]|tara:strand:+ start:1012 stop:2040 length:1029 start_codon:yes stop_codon:yes gene_type:complete